MLLTKPQRKALKKVYDRQLGNDTPSFETYRELRKAVLSGSFDCIMINMGYIWLGIEQDGYTHS